MTKERYKRKPLEPQIETIIEAKTQTPVVNFRSQLERELRYQLAKQGQEEQLPKFTVKFPGATNNPALQELLRIFSLDSLPVLVTSAEGLAPISHISLKKNNFSQFRITLVDETGRQQLGGMFNCGASGYGYSYLENYSAGRVKLGDIDADPDHRNLFYLAFWRPDDKNIFSFQMIFCELK